MNVTKILPLILCIAMGIQAGICLCRGMVPDALYWFGGAILNASFLWR